MNIEIIEFIILGLAIIGVIGWFIVSLKVKSVSALTKLEMAQKSLEEQKTLFETMKREMVDTFNSLSKSALESSNESFLTLASERLGRIVEETKGKLGEHQATMGGLVKPLHDALKRYEEQIHAIESDRKEDYGSIISASQQLQKEVSNLSTALRKPQVRGRWGEMQLRRAAELSGMSIHCDFTEQQSIDTEKGKIRPDMIVHLPMRDIIVDSKVSLEAYLDAINSSTEDERKIKMKEHSQQIRAHMNRLASKEYWSQFERSPELVVLFIPGESFLSAALDIDNTLIEDAIQNGIFIASPTIFIALLKAIAYGWRQEELTKHVQQISQLGKELYERMDTMIKYFDELGSAIEKSLDSYNKIIGSWESRVSPSLRKFKELGVTSTGDIPALEQIDRKARKLGIVESDNNKTNE